jgi:UDP-4-amino-4,6-dideoxy-N-acetyl-beta-L-altrosamine transaminase|tara:strand:+ start:6114 stop:7268 length:1155 start_codon:yes stop_codon:yes gene_type:complete
VIPYGRQDITSEDIEEVIKVLNSDFLTQGPLLPKFEKSISTYCGVSYAYAMNSATSALHIACMALEVGRGDIVWTAANTFAASSNCALYCNASIDFVDIDPVSYNMSISDLKSKLQLAETEGCLPKVLIPVHMTGQSCEMSEIFELSKKYGFKIIEDASHAIGGKYLNNPIGCCKYSDITVFSFHPVKIITTGEGGMAVTNNENLAQKISLLRSHGITRDSNLMSKEDGPWYYEQIDLGYNYRMTEIQGALGLSQMNRLDEYIKRRHDIANFYNESLSELPLQIPKQFKDSFSSFHLYVIRLNLSMIESSHKDIFESLRKDNILVNLHYMPVYLHPYYKNNLGFKSGHCPEAEKYYSEAISIPMFPTLSNEDQLVVVNALKKYL